MEQQKVKPSGIHWDSVPGGKACAWNRHSHTPHRIRTLGWNRLAQALLLLLLVLCATGAGQLPIRYYFDEGIVFSGFFLLLVLGLYGPATCSVSGLLVYLVLYLNNPDALCLVHAVQVLLVSVVYHLLNRRLLLAQTLFWLVVVTPAFLAAMAFHIIARPDRFLLVLAKDLVVSLLEAVAAEAFLFYVFPQVRRWLQRRADSGGTPRDVAEAPGKWKNHVPVRNLLIHAAFGPLLLCSLLLFVFSGGSAMKSIIETARSLSSQMADGLQREVEGWTMQERQSLALDGIIELARLEDAYRSVSRNIPGELVLFDRDGKEQMHVHGSYEEFHMDWTSLVGYDLGNGLQFVAKYKPIRNFDRMWVNGVFMWSFRLERQVAVIALPLHLIDNAIDMQFLQLMTAGPFILLALVLLLFVSTMIERSLNHLAEGTTRLLAGLGGGRRAEVPSSGILEVDALADNFRFMNGTLDDLFQELQSANDDLQSQSEQLRRSESEMFRLAHFDVLTQLPNRFYLRQSLKTLLEAESRKPFSLVLVDLDRFKPINDLHGHHVGDLVLQEVGHIFRRVIGDSIEGGRFACRLGGDEFVAVILDETPDMVRNLVRELIGALSEPIRVAGLTLQVLASAGISRYPDHGMESGILLKQADQAMYRAKQLGGNAFAEGGDAG